MEDGYLCGSISEWQTRRIRDLSEDKFSYPDIAWSIEGNILPDIRNVYTCSSFFQALFETTMSRGIEKTPEGIPIFVIPEKYHIFDMIRVYCHTGLVRFSKSDTILKTLERYSAFQYYDIEGGKAVLKKLVIEKITPSNATQAFEYAIHRDDSDLLKAINEYISAHAFVVLKHRNFYNIRRESMHHLACLCSNDDLNIPEIELLSSLYGLCQKKIGDKEYPEFKSASEILKFKFEDKSLWDSIRLKQITLPDFMGFVKNNEQFMDNDAIVDAMKLIYDPSTIGKKRKRFQMISSYPRNLSIQSTGSSQADVIHLEKDKVRAFVVFDLTSREEIMLPHITYGDRTVRCIVKTIDKTICVTGSILSRNDREDDGKENVKVTTSIVNFKHDRWKKTTVSVNLGNRDFEIQNMISWNAIDSVDSGYMFDIYKYPEYVVGKWLMMYISVDGT